MWANNLDYEKIAKRIRACDYIVVAQLFLQDNFLLERPLSFTDVKPRLLGHWGTCHGINAVYAYLQKFFAHDQNFSFVLGPGHGFPALQANLFYDGELAKIDSRATNNSDGLAYLCKHFSWPGGFPSHSSPLTPNIICEGGELGYCLGAAYGASLGHPEKTIAVLIGDGELETATALASLNLVKLFGEPANDNTPRANGRVIPILHLNGYKISAPTIYGRKSERELSELIRGFGYTPIFIDGETSERFREALLKADLAMANRIDANSKNPFLIFRSPKGDTGPQYVHNQKVADNFLAHQIPLKDAKTDSEELQILENWLKSYHFEELFDKEKGFIK